MGEGREGTQSDRREHTTMHYRTCQQVHKPEWVCPECLRCDGCCECPSDERKEPIHRKSKAAAVKAFSLSKSN